jgi:hypothetical protein
MGLTYEVRFYRRHEDGGKEWRDYLGRGWVAGAASADDARARALRTTFAVRLAAHGPLDLDTEPVLLCPGCEEPVNGLTYRRNVRVELSGTIDVRVNEGGVLEVRYSEHEEEGQEDLDDPEYEVLCRECDHDLTDLLREACVQQEAWTAVEAEEGASDALHGGLAQPARV